MTKKRNTWKATLVGAAAGLLLAAPLTAGATSPEGTAPAVPPTTTRAGAPIPATGAAPTADPGGGTAAPGARPPTGTPTFPPRNTPAVTGTDPSRAEAGATMPPTQAPPALSAAETKLAKNTLTELHKVNIKEIALGRLGQEKATSPAVKEYAQQLVTDHESADKKVMDFSRAHDLMVGVGNGMAVGRALPGEPTAPADTGLRRPASTTPGAAAPGDPASATGSTGPSGARGNSGSATAGSAPGGAMAGTSAPGSASGSVSDQSPIDAELDAEGRRLLTRLQKLEGAKFEKQFLTEMVRGHNKTVARLKAAERKAKDPGLQGLLNDLRTSVEGHLEKARAIQKGGAT